MKDLVEFCFEHWAKSVVAILLFFAGCSGIAAQLSDITIKIKRDIGQ